MSEPESAVSEPEGAAVPGLRSRFVATREGGASKRPQVSEPESAAAGRTLVAGVGNVFLGDDAFGSEVARLLASRPGQPGVVVKDFGIRGVHLVYELLDGCDLFVLIDAAPRGNPPGTVSVLEVEPSDCVPGQEPSLMDAHGLAPDEIFAMLNAMGGRPGRSLVVACEPADLSPGMGLSAEVQAALPHAVRAVEEILRTNSAESGCA